MKMDRYARKTLGIIQKKTLKIGSPVKQRYCDTPYKRTVFIISLPIKTAVLLLKSILEKFKEIYEHVGFLVECVS